MVENAAEILRQTGLWLGWLGGALLSASLVLMIREPLVARAVGGLESMYRWHHRLAVLAYVLLLAHPLALAAAVAMHDVRSAWLAISPSQSSPANAIGWIALLGLVAGLATTFMWRLNYGAWRRLHMTLAAAVLLAIAHVLDVEYVRRSQQRGCRFCQSVSKGVNETCHDDVRMSLEVDCRQTTQRPPTTLLATRGFVRRRKSQTVALCRNE